MKICTGCRFYRAARQVNPVNGETFPIEACDRPRADGKAWSAHTERQFGDLCGPSARFFEARTAATEAA
jgi:hypothetical protein